MFKSMHHLKAETASVFEKDYEGQEVEDIIDVFLKVLDDNGGKISFPTPPAGQARTVQVGCATSRERSGAKRK